MSDHQTSTRCDACGAAFEVRFRYQTREENGRFVHVCSTRCQRKMLLGRREQSCNVCAKSFQVEFPYQVRATDAARIYLCSMECASAFQAPRTQTRQRIAVFNHKGGTGKTTTAISLAAALAERGERVLLVDADGQGNVGASLGIRGEQTLYHVLVHGAPVSECAITVRQNLDVLTSNETLAAAELHLAQLPQRDRILRERFAGRVHGYDRVVIDCAPALSVMNQNALVYADSLLVPVACDYLSLVGVRQVLKTLKNVRRLLKHELELLGVVPTFFDGRNRIARESLAALQKHFGDRCYEPVRTNTKLREAPGRKMTIYEHAPQSHGAQDYLRLVDRLTTRDERVVRKTFSRPVPAKVVAHA